MDLAPATLPNVCKMPGPPAPFVPTPLPNIGRSGDKLKKCTKKVLFEGKKVAIKGSYYMSIGDIASKGTGGGILSATTHGKTKFVAPGSMNVKAEGKNIQLLGDAMSNNGNTDNSATVPGNQQAPDVPQEIVIKLDCGGYPADEAPLWKQDKNPERWEVRPTQNGRSTRLPEHSDTNQLREAFRRRYDEGINPRERGLLRDLLQGPSPRPVRLPGTGAQIVEMITRLGQQIYSFARLGGRYTAYMPNFHHLRPTWAGGGNAPSNIWPVEPGHAPVGVHNWWNERLQRAVTPEQRNLLLGKTPPPTVNTISENNMGKMAEKCQNMDPPKKLVVEMDCPEAVSS